MKPLNLSLTLLVLTLMAFIPAGARADEDMDGLDATMIVLDDVSDLDEAIAEIDGPDDDDVEDVDWEYEYEENTGRVDKPAGGGEPEEGFEDEFEGDQENEEDAFEEEDDFEDGEDVDDDAFDDEDD